MPRKKKHPCPRCGSTKTIPIKYGMPSPALALKASEGKLILGGCCILNDSPDTHCTECEYEWLGDPVKREKEFGPFELPER
ncbi:MAG: hypothetical protein CL946_07460 [Ectothiorhodospiraceae bacterium]|nr:hypothetical protein [Ectothiorhodospiraceae bacterium]